MAVAEKDAEHLAARFEQVRDVGQDEVDPEHVLLGEHEPCVDDEDLVLPLERPHVDADLTEAAERQVSKPAHKRRSCSASCLGIAIGSGGGGGGARSLSRYAFTRSKS